MSESEFTQPKTDQPPDSTKKSSDSESSESELNELSFQLPSTPLNSKANLEKIYKFKPELFTPHKINVHKLKNKFYQSSNTDEIEIKKNIELDIKSDHSESELDEKIKSEIHSDPGELEYCENTPKTYITYRRRKKIKKFNSEGKSRVSFKKLKMSDTKLTYTDMINAIPIFEGHQKDLDYFISTCSTYNEIIEVDQREMFVSIIKTRLKGIALTKMEPVSELVTWALIKTRLEEKFKRPMTYETAQDELSNIRQSRTESIEIYGNNIRFALHKLNKATESLTTEAGALKLLRVANEKMATRKFEQGLYNNNLKICVGARDYTTLDTAIANAMLKEGLYRNESRVRCNYCNITGHTEKECRRKQQTLNTPNRSNNDNNRYRQPNSPNKNEANTSGNSNNYRNRNNSNRWDNNNGNNGRNGNNIKHNSNSPGNSNNSFSNQNSPNNKNVPQNTRKFTNRSITIDEALKEETKN